MIPYIFVRALKAVDQKQPLTPYEPVLPRLQGIGLLDHFNRLTRKGVLALRDFRDIQPKIECYAVDLLIALKRERSLKRRFEPVLPSQSVRNLKFPMAGLVIGHARHLGWVTKDLELTKAGEAAERVHPSEGRDA